MHQNTAADAPAAAAFADGLGAEETRDIAEALNGLFSDIFALYLKTKNFHWYMTGPHFRDYHQMLGEQSAQVFAMSDVLAECVRKIGHLALPSIGEIARKERFKDDDALSAAPREMLAELQRDNGDLARSLREFHGMIPQQNDGAAASVLELYLDETERRAFFLDEARHATPRSA